jgi:hypothetical protein
MKCAERIGGYLPSGKVLTMSLASLGVMSFATLNTMNLAKPLCDFARHYDMIALLTSNEA